MDIITAVVVTAIVVIAWLCFKLKSVNKHEMLKKRLIKMVSSGEAIPVEWLPARNYLVLEKGKSTIVLRQLTSCCVGMGQSFKVMVPGIMLDKMRVNVSYFIEYDPTEGEIHYGNPSKPNAIAGSDLKGDQVKEAQQMQKVAMEVWV